MTAGGRRHVASLGAARAGVPGDAGLAHTGVNLGAAGRRRRPGSAPWVRATFVDAVAPITSQWCCGNRVRRSGATTHRRVSGSPARSWTTVRPPPPTSRTGWPDPCRRPPPSRRPRRRGAVEAREQRVYGTRGRGRPAKVFALTDCGRDAFDQAYDELAADALRFITETGGDGRGVGVRPPPGRPRIERATVRDRRRPQPPRTRTAGARAGAHARRVRCHGAPGARSGEQLCQHHCPVAHVAAQFPQLCEAETEVFSRLLGTPCPAAGHHRPRRRRVHDLRARTPPAPVRHRTSRETAPEEPRMTRPR